MASADLKENLICSICLDVCTDPIVLSCGHNFCWACIPNVLDTQEGSGISTCPDCRADIQEYPALERGHSLCDRTDILCAYCIHSPVPAVIACLHCKAYLCENHLGVHNKSEEHVLPEPNVLCCKKKIVMNNSLGDATCVSVACSLSEEHEAPQGEKLNKASEERGKKLRNVLAKLSAKREETEERVQSLQERRREVQEKAAIVTERVAGLFTDTRAQLDDLEKRVLSNISRQEEQISLSFSDLIRQLEIKKDELCRKMSLIEELCNMTDPMTIFQGWKSVKDDFAETERGRNKDTELNAIKGLDEGLISVTLHTALSSIVTCVKRGFYVQQAPDIVLNENTASNDICLSDDLKSATGSAINQNRPNTAERFQYTQVVSSRSFSSGHYYWELETCETGHWRVGVSYPSIARKGYHSVIGYNTKSWGLCRYFNLYFVIHDRKVIPVLQKPLCQRLGIYLDYDAGHLCFYELCHPIRHLHTFTATFIEPLHLALSVYAGWVRISS
ncbi:E3 ubiquitin-protein ligase TRIM39-like [Pseudophryne corroboree]|uniref:E3 ubiquitin-protein ligase TRIM39-like n=1 Tax=Pseudophryne corroboree TaxID=495146 RepID=UPI003081B76A